MAVFVNSFIYIICYITYIQAEEADNAKLTENFKSIYLSPQINLDFNKEDNNINKQFVDNQEDKDIGEEVEEQNIIEKEENNKDTETFSDFIQHAIEILNNYDDTDLELFIKTFNEEIRKYHYRKCKFYELLDDIQFRKFIANKLNIVRNKKANFIRIKLTTISDNLKYENCNENERKLINYINSLYNQDWSETFKKYLTYIDGFRLKTRKTLSDLTKIIRDGIRTIIFDHYTSLRKNDRKSLRTVLYGFWRDFKALVQILNNYLSSNSAEATPTGITEQETTEKLTISTTEKEEEKQTSQKELFIYRQVPTKNKIKKKYAGTELRDNTIKRDDEKSRYINKKNIQKNNIKTTKKYNKRSEKYVERNLDLKYNPYASDVVKKPRKYKKYEHPALRIAKPINSIRNKIKDKIQNEEKSNQRNKKLNVAQKINLKYGSTVMADGSLTQESISRQKSRVTKKEREKEMMKDQPMHIVWQGTNINKTRELVKNKVQTKSDAFKENQIRRMVTPWWRMVNAKHVKVQIHIKKTEMPQLHLKKPEFQLNIPYFK